MIVIAPHLDAAREGKPFDTRDDVLAYMVERERALRGELIKRDAKIGRMGRLASEILAVQSGSAPLTNVDMGIATRDRSA